MDAKGYLIVLFLAITRKSTAQFSEDDCITPHGKSGTCVVLPSCPSLNALIRKRPISQESVNLLRQSSCGFTANLPNVCCPMRESNSVRYSQFNSLIPGLEICGQNTEERIYGGRETNLDEFPWMALLEYARPNGRSFSCGGVLISSRYVLTAAHCVKGSGIPKTFRLISVRLGEHNTATDIDCSEDGGCAPPPIDVPVESTDVHEEYEPNDISQPNDIALIRLSTDVDFNDYIQPICLPHLNEALLRQSLVGKDLYAAGWGTTENRSQSDVKLKVRLPVVDQNSCKRKYLTLGAQIIESQLCAGGRAGEDSCRGDSGGPLMGLEITEGRANWFVFGLVSYGPALCGTFNWPGVYTRVGDFSEWISNRVLK